MQDSNSLIHQAAQEIAQSANSSTTAAGPTDTNTSRPRLHENLVDTINQVFELFRINYHNQYYSAFNNIETLNHAKRLWAETLGRFPAKTILQGARKAIETCEYLPTLHKMIRCCEGELSVYGLPESRNAYIEACQAPSPKIKHAWSHPAVYLAGREAGWYLLANNPEHIAFPVFEQHYQALCQKVIKGEQLPMPEIKALPEEIDTPLTKEENIQRLQKLRETFDI